MREEITALNQLAARLSEVGSEVTSLGKEVAALLEHNEATDARLDGLHHALVENREGVAAIRADQLVTKTKLDALGSLIEKTRPLLSRPAWRIGSAVAVLGVLVTLGRIALGVLGERSDALAAIRTLQGKTVAAERDREATYDLIAGTCRWQLEIASKVHVIDGTAERCDSLKVLGERARIRAEGGTP